LRALVTSVVVAILLTGGSAASAQQPTGGTAPAYPGNTLRLEQIRPIVAGTVVQVHMSGRAEWGEPTDDSTIPYSLWIYAQNADVHPSCEQSYGAQQEKAINIPTLGASETLTDWVLAGSIQVNPSPPHSGEDWSIESLPFVVSLGVRRLLLCAYQRYVTDDVAWYQLPVRVHPPSCRIAERGSVRRGDRLRLRCNVRGRMTLRFKRRGVRARAITVTVGSNGRAFVPTDKLGAGTYRVTVSIGRLRLGTHRGLRIR
jgi:hypothetical protein